MGTINLNQLTIFHNVSNIEKSNAHKFADGLLFVPRIAFGYEKLKVTNQNGVTDKLFPIIEKTRSLCLRTFLGFVAFTVMLPLTFVAIIIKACLMKSQLTKTVSLLKGLQELQKKAPGAPILSGKNLELRLATVSNSKSTLFNNDIKNIVGSFLNVREFGRLRTTCYLGSRISPVTYLHYTPSSIQEMIFRTWGKLPTSGIWKEALITNSTRIAKIDLSGISDISTFINTHEPLFSHVSSIVGNFNYFSEPLRRIASWNRLTEFTQLDWCDFLNLAPIFANQKLKKLTLFDPDHWTFPTEKGVKPCSALEELDFTSSRGEPDHLLGIGKFTSLKKFTLNTNQDCSAQLAVILPQLPLLQELSLKGKRYQAEDFAALIHAPSLTSLEIDITGFWGNTIASLKTLSDSLTSLKRIELKIAMPLILNLQRYNEIIQEIDLLSSIGAIDKIHVLFSLSRGLIDTRQFIGHEKNRDKNSTKEQTALTANALAHLLKKHGNKVVSLNYDNYRSGLDTPILKLLSSIPLLPCKIFRLRAVKANITELISVLNLMPNLEELDLNSSHFTYEGTWTDTLLPIQSLEKLKLSNCDLSSEFMQALAKSISSKLHVLSLVSSIGFLEKDLKLILENGNFIGLSLGGLGRLGGLGGLKGIITDEIITTLVAFQKNLVSLSLSFCEISPKAASALCDMTSLMALDIDQSVLNKIPHGKAAPNYAKLNSIRPAMKELTFYRDDGVS